MRPRCSSDFPTVAAAAATSASIRCGGLCGHSAMAEAAATSTSSARARMQETQRWRLRRRRQLQRQQACGDEVCANTRRRRQRSNISKLAVQKRGRRPTCCKLCFGGCCHHKQCHILFCSVSLYTPSLCDALLCFTLLCFAFLCFDSLRFASLRFALFTPLRFRLRFASLPSTFISLALLSFLLFSLALFCWALPRLSLHSRLQSPPGIPYAC